MLFVCGIVECVGGGCGGLVCVDWLYGWLVGCCCVVCAGVFSLVLFAVMFDCDVCCV